MTLTPALDSLAALVDSLREVVSSTAAGGDTLAVKALNAPSGLWSSALFQTRVGGFI